MSEQPAGPRATGPLVGFRVIDLGMIFAGPLVATNLGDLGADVIKIEPPDGGDGSRRMAVLPGMPSTFFETNNRGVKSVTLNLKSPEGRAILHKLVAKADIFGQNFRPGGVWSRAPCTAAIVCFRRGRFSARPDVNLSQASLASLESRNSGYKFRYDSGSTGNCGKKFIGLTGSCRIF